MNQHKNIFLNVLDFPKILWYNTIKKAEKAAHIIKLFGGMRYETVLVWYG